MEVGAGVLKTDRLALALDVGEHQNVGNDWMVELVDHMRLGLTQAARKVVELLRRELLPAHHQHMMGEPGVPQLAEHRVVELCQIGIMRLDAEAIAQH